MKVEGAFVMPKDMTVYSYDPYRVVKAVFGMSSDLIFFVVTQHEVNFREDLGSG
jgi:hypothetical protein